MTRLNTSDNCQVPPACISKGFLVIFKLKSLNNWGPHLIIPVIKRSNNVKVPDHEITTVLSLIVWRVRNVSSHGRACVTFQPAPHLHWQNNTLDDQFLLDWSWCWWTPPTNHYCCYWLITGGRRAAGGTNYYMGSRHHQTNTRLYILFESQSSGR